MTETETGAICGGHLNFDRQTLTKRKPKNWIFEGYKIITPFKFKWRHKVGKTECDCTQCIEHFRPWYGVTWFHMKGCAYVKRFEDRPSLLNLNPFAAQDVKVIAKSE